MAEAHWASVRVLDADDLDTWIESCPAVHLWLSRELGKYTDDALDLDTYWSEWSTVTRPPLTTDFLLAGHERATDRDFHLGRPGSKQWGCPDRC